MEIVIGIIFFCVVVALCYSWARSTETPEEAMTPADPRYGLYHNAANNYPVGDPIPSMNEPGGSTGVTQPSSPDTTSQQDCSTNSGPDSQSVDCPCPDDSTGYDAAGFSVDSSVGNSN